MPFNQNDIVEELYIVRLYDGFDNEWTDITKPISKLDADKIFNDKTEGGKVKTQFSDIDYYKIFPSNTKMIFSS